MIIMFVIYSKSVDEEIVELVKKYASGYTKFIDVLGEGNNEPQLGTHVWPGRNNCLMISMENKNEKGFVKGTKELKKRFPGIGIHIMTAALKSVV